MRILWSVSAKVNAKNGSTRSSSSTMLTVKQRDPLQTSRKGAARSHAAPSMRQTACANRMKQTRLALSTLSISRGQTLTPVDLPIDSAPAPRILKSVEESYSRIRLLQCYKIQLIFWTSAHHLSMKQQLLRYRGMEMWLVLLLTSPASSLGCMKRLGQVMSSQIC